MSAAREPTPEDLAGYAEKLGMEFINHYDKCSTLNPARYFSTKCNDLRDQFLDSLSLIGGSRTTSTFTVSHFGDEIKPTPKESESIGDKRGGSELAGPDHKKRRLNDPEHKGNVDGMDSDDDISMDSDDEDKPKKKGKRKKLKLPEKYKDDEDFQSLEAPRDTASTANEFFDPISHCKINLDRESRMNARMRDRLHKFQMNDDDVDINGEHIKYIDRTQIDRFVKETGNSNGYTVQQDVSTLMCLGLMDHLKNMFDEMDQWRKRRLDHYGQHFRKRPEISVKDSGPDAQEWMDRINSKYAEKQQIVEAQDELDTLLSEQADLSVRRMTAILSAEEEKRLNQLPGKIQAAKNKQKASAERRDQINVSAMKALGGDFSFGGRGKKKAKELRADKYYVIDIVNMLGEHQRMNQQHLKQLSRLHLKQTS